MGRSPFNFILLFLSTSFYFLLSLCVINQLFQRVGILFSMIAITIALALPSSSKMFFEKQLSIKASFICVFVSRETNLLETLLCV